jgi:hypothetical protein
MLQNLARRFVIGTRPIDVANSSAAVRVLAQELRLVAVDTSGRDCHRVSMVTRSI